jgi:hypothetical protein
MIISSTVCAVSPAESKAIGADIAEDWNFRDPLSLRERREDKAVYLSETNHNATLL